MTNTKKLVTATTIALTIITLLSTALTAITDMDLFLTISITAGTTLYHFAMRLFVGKVTPHHFNYKSVWFKEKSFEKPLYKKLRVKKWKDKMPSYNPSTYLTKEISLYDLINTMCRNEVIHEIIAVLSFVPILFSLIIDTYFVFIITSVIACLFDLIFVIMQRYNRPRVIKVLEKYNKSK